jgi:small subunit ribosomal protein S20
MAHSNSAMKRIRQNETHRDRNRAARSALRTQVKKVREAIEAGDVAVAKSELAAAMKQADKTAGSTTMHANTAGRLKSKLSRAVNAM